MGGTWRGRSESRNFICSVLPRLPHYCAEIASPPSTRRQKQHSTTEIDRSKPRHREKANNQSNGDEVLIETKPRHRKRPQCRRAPTNFRRQKAGKTRRPYEETLKATNHKTTTGRIRRDEARRRVEEAQIREEQQRKLSEMAGIHSRNRRRSRCCELGNTRRRRNPRAKKPSRIAAESPRKPQIPVSPRGIAAWKSGKRNTNAHALDRRPRSQLETNKKTKKKEGEIPAAPRPPADRRTIIGGVRQQKRAPHSRGNQPEKPPARQESKPRTQAHTPTHDEITRDESSADRSRGKAETLEGPATNKVRRTQPSADAPLVTS